jgi:hypothetical protein
MRSGSNWVEYCTTSANEVCGYSYSTFAGPVPDARMTITADWRACLYCGKEQKYPDDGNCAGCGAGRQHSKPV